jgi:hypothetical protein
MWRDRRSGAGKFSTGYLALFPVGNLGADVWGDGQERFTIELAGRPPDFVMKR